jgi:hypothetical protein
MDSGAALRAACLLGALLVCACSDDDAAAAGGGDDGGGGHDAGPDRADGGGAGDGSAVFDADAPLSAPHGTWTWVDFPNTQCRDGSSAGLGLSLNEDSRKVMIFLQGGGACFDALTCAGNPSNVSGQRGELRAGLFARREVDNPVRDWNHVLVPYCTGDVHAGTQAEGAVDGVPGTQRFVGRLNLEQYLRRIVPTFPDAEQVLLTGISAGGFGAAASVKLVQEAFGDVPVTLIDDSGPPMSSTYLPECLQRRWRQTWGLDGSILRDCGGDCPRRDDFMVAYTLHVARAYPERLGGLIETTADSVITLFFGYGAGDCTGSLLTPLPAADFTAGLLEYRAILQDEGANLGTYYIDGDTHTWLASDALYARTTDGVRLIDWVADIVQGRGAAHVGP